MNKERLVMTSKKQKKPEYDEDKDQLEEEQEGRTGEKGTTNQVF
jgi:hypothetical protein